jgi:hypothetical protein
MQKVQEEADELNFTSSVSLVIKSVDELSSIVAHITESVKAELF